MMHKEHFADELIDDISEDPNNNYFTPVLKEAFVCVSI